MLEGYIDSVAFEVSNKILADISLFGVLTTVKNGGLVFNALALDEFVNKRAKKAKSLQLRDLKNLYSYLAIVETQTGLRYKITQHKRAKRATITFQGLTQYTEKSILMRYDIDMFIELYSDSLILNRVDVAIDSKEPFNIAKIANRSKRKTFAYYGTTYLKTSKEKRVNGHMDIKYYFKEEPQLFRLEFVFKKSFLSTKNLKSKVERTIKKAVGRAMILAKPLYLIS